MAGYEATARIVSSLSFAASFYLALVRIRAVPDLSGKTDIHERTGILLTATSLGFGVGMLYEVGAWAPNGLFDARPFTFDELIAHMTISFSASVGGGGTLLSLGPARLARRAASPPRRCVKPPRWPSAART